MLRRGKMHDRSCYISLIVGVIAARSRTQGISLKSCLYPVTKTLGDLYPVLVSWTLLESVDWSNPTRQPRRNQATGY